MHTLSQTSANKSAFFYELSRMGPLTGIFNYQYDLQVVPYVFLRGVNSQ